ncbi:serine--tRNA ligase [Actinokineospora sp. NBRC 105648]|uniref:serine--tRNA ligase n=1 Tax=Actinokineospora sp. NBRC 105648 TaxID=3032206 RepID=UPI0024A0C424|nr:serine--tRNA ligase [Actinokineospora sp. NBRC 105648]GLZ39229.1 serine--tRNA ligase [Actinokineospora sp. NBRC 105648]
MHEAKTLLEPEAAAALHRRGYDLDVAALAELARERKELMEATQKLRGESNRLAKEGRTGGEAVRARAKEVKEQIQELEVGQKEVQTRLHDLLLTIPNLPSADAPDGKSDEDAVEVRRVGEPRTYDFEPRHHADIGESTGILDLGRAAKLSGARFAVTSGAGAVLERALASFFLDLHTREHGYTEYSVPTLVTRETMTGTGQLPKFEDDLFKTAVGGRELFLIPTAEVPLTNLYAGESIDAGALPLALTARTQCFRAEAGSYGRDTRGILRMHEFTKVELVRIVNAESSRAELELMVSHAEECLKRLELAYRVVALAAGDLGFSATYTYDIEVWLPGQDRYREISSCSDTGTFQARRAGIRLRGKERGFPATLNGSGLPVGRTLLALLEQHQTADGGVDIPAALVPYTGFRRIAADGSVVR